MPHLFDFYQLKNVTIRNRIGVSPMCQYWPYHAAQELHKKDAATLPVRYTSRV